MSLLQHRSIFIVRAMVIFTITCAFVFASTLAVASNAPLPDIKVYKFSSDADPAGLNILINKQDSYKLDKGVCNDVMNKVWKENNDKWPSQIEGIDRHIALLVHGFPALTPFENRKYLAKLAMNLRKIGYDDVYAVEYPPDRHINETGEALAQIIVNRCVNFPDKQKFDIFAHSMGGLVARCALEGVSFQGKNLHADRKVAHLVTLGTPHNGLTDNIFKVWLGQTVQQIKYKGKLLENDDLKKTSDFLKALNNGGGEADCNYYQVGSNNSTKPYEYRKGVERWALNNQVFVGKVHDGLIVYDSSLFNIEKHSTKPVKQKTIGVNHDFLICHDSVFNCLNEWIFSDNWLCSFPIKGAILTHWISKGGRSYLGYPISNEYDVVDGRRQDFEKGSLKWNRLRNSVEMITKVTSTAVVPITDLPKIKINPKDGSEMILIPAGEFLMGNTDAYKHDPHFIGDENPQRKVYIDAYYMYKTEVTVAQYRKFCTATGRKMPDAPDWGWQDTHPIVNVNWNDAKAYADWSGATLPTEAQWEKAARGGDGRIYPWGNTWDASKCVNYTNSSNGTKPVGSILSGASPYGVMDMAGNAWEWCADWYGADYYKNASVKNPIGPVTGEYRVLRGGSWRDYYGNGYYGYGAFRNSGGPDVNYCFMGFRCTVSLPEIVIPSVEIPVKAPVTQLPNTKINPKDGAEMMFIPAGEFLMGSTDADKHARDYEKPQRKVYMDSYYMYKTEVTVAQYRKFCTATGREMPLEPSWKWQDTHPIVNVTWNDAKAYADWACVSLPTEAQWEKAARGKDGRIYPWGNEWDDRKCANWINSGRGNTTSGTHPVGSFPTGASPYGVLDVSGNVWEWCSDWYGYDYYKNALGKNPTGPEIADYRVLRGGSWDGGGDDFDNRSAYRGMYYDPNSICYSFGFRCASPGLLPLMDIPVKESKINLKDGAEMILIPAGEFLMGSTDADKDADGDEKPQRKVYLDAYYMYKTEVTVAQYRKFCKVTGKKMPDVPNFGWNENHPMVNVKTWNDAKAYADWAGVVLPSEAQWEKAARGTDGRIYPWGNAWDETKCANYANSGGDGNTKCETHPVGSFPTGASPYGVMDMAGNVWEWCADWYGADYYKNHAPAYNPTGPVTGDRRVLRGGSWYNDCWGHHYYFRGAYRLNIHPSSLSGDLMGFRCASPGP